MSNMIFLRLSLVTCFTAIYGNDYREKFTGQFKYWKHKRLDLIALFLPKNPVILQAGAYSGDETTHMARLWPEGKIIAFEPNPHAYDILHTKILPFKNIEIYKRALNDHSGHTTLYVCHGTSGNDPSFEHASSLLCPSKEMEIHYQGPRIQVKGIVLDDWCKQHQVTHIDLLRLDLQGLELQVLKSSPEILRTVKVVFIETNLFPFRIGTTLYPKLYDFLKQSGFRLLSHWYKENLVGSAIFIRNDFFEGPLRK